VDVLDVAARRSEVVEEIPGPSRAKSAEQRQERKNTGRYSEDLRRRDATAI